MKALFFVFLFAVLRFAPAHAHEITFSHVDVRLERDTRIVARLPIKALMHEQPTLLPAGTTEQTLRSEPLAADVRATLAHILVSRLRLCDGERVLPISVTSVQLTGEEFLIISNAPPVQGVLEMQANLFPDDALHKVFINVYREADLVGQFAVDRDNPTFKLAATERPLGDVISTFARAGIHHIFIGADHILFVLALLLLGGTLWSQVEVVTAFTLAHSVTLVLVTLNVVQLPSRLVESAIALSVVVVGLHDLAQLRGWRAAPAGRDPRTVFAFGFGLVHGFGFASVLAELDLPKHALAWSLAAFNVGVEIGQMSIVLLATPLLVSLRRYASPRFKQLCLTAAASGVVFAGVFWLGLRALGP